MTMIIIQNKRGANRTSKLIYKRAVAVNALKRFCYPAFTMNRMDERRASGDARCAFVRYITPVLHVAVERNVLISFPACNSKS